MAIIKPRCIQEGAISYIRDVVGYRLSTIQNPNKTSSMRAVIKSRANGIRPNYPYITVGVITTGKESGAWLRHEYVDEATDRPVYISEQEVVLQIRCVGDDAEDILTELRINTLGDISRANLNEEAQATFQDFSVISDRPYFENTDFVDGAETFITFTAVSTWCPVSGSVIENINVDGEYFRFKDDPNPIDVHINVTSSENN